MFKQQDTTKKKSSFSLVGASVALVIAGIFMLLIYLDQNSESHEKIMMAEFHAVNKPIEESPGMASSIDDAQFAPSMEPPYGNWSGITTAYDNKNDSKIVIDLTIGRDKSFSIQQTMFAKGEARFSNSASGFYEMQGKVIRFNVASGKKGFFSTSRRIVIQVASPEQILVRGVIAGHEEQSMVLRAVKSEDEPVAQEPAANESNSQPAEPALGIDESTETVLQDVPTTTQAQ